MNKKIKNAIVALTLTTIAFTGQVNLFANTPKTTTTQQQKAQTKSVGIGINLVKIWNSPFETDNSFKNGVPVGKIQKWKGNKQYLADSDERIISINFEKEKVPHPYFYKGVGMLPIQVIAKKIGYKYSYNAKTKVGYIASKDYAGFYNKFSFKVGSKSLTYYTSYSKWSKKWTTNMPSAVAIAKGIVFVPNSIMSEDNKNEHARLNDWGSTYDTDTHTFTIAHAFTNILQRYPNGIDLTESNPLINKITAKATKNADKNSTIVHQQLDWQGFYYMPFKSNCQDMYVQTFIEWTADYSANMKKPVETTFAVKGWFHPNSYDLDETYLENRVEHYLTTVAFKQVLRFYFPQSYMKVYKVFEDHYIYNKEDADYKKIYTYDGRQVSFYTSTNYGGTIIGIGKKSVKYKVQELWLKDA